MRMKEKEKEREKEKENVGGRERERTSQQTLSMLWASSMMTMESATFNLKESLTWGSRR
jgi:hypothetical protein